MTAYRFEIRGRVQGVGFRAFFEKKARQEALHGWVRNRRDGSVEALLSPLNDVQAEDFAAILEMGPGRVDSVSFHASDEAAQPGFEIRSTL
ncbi:MAG: acylphosphatase [Fimbriimonadaceae bacterium]|nr:acylphosphatase [Fimbriimonadaceae bacterium]